MDFPEDLFYTKTHEWAKKEGDNKVRVGITSHAQSELGDVVYIELPDLDRIVKAGTACTVVESVKAAFDIYAPVSGKVIETNNDLENNPQLVNENPYGKGWFSIIEMEDPQELTKLLSNKDYEKLCQSK
ncbi:MAG TPA: glycine cleavage system protein GcvH [Candidatus Scalindua sp.]|jgi:glycine cleavage system H protein|nr:glycine cleavage system protein GcvH [Candidatus Scalindua sp.]|tara:strand:+ start:98 stop:484 length:387 start_codon:yes stop_codon:yes gene_type:complete